MFIPDSISSFVEHRIVLVFIFWYSPPSSPYSAPNVCVLYEIPPSGNDLALIISFSLSANINFAFCSIDLDMNIGFVSSVVSPITTGMPFLLCQLFRKLSLLMCRLKIVCGRN